MRALVCSLVTVLSVAAPSASALAQAVQPVAATTIQGKVVDASTGLGLPDALVVVLDAGRERATTDASGNFHIAGVPIGIARVEIRKSGYQTTDSDEFATVAGSSASVTLSLQRAQQSTQELGVIGHTSTRASQSLQKTSVIYKGASATAIQDEGNYRVGDYLRTLPFVNANGGSETPTPGDDLYMDVRGLGPLETVTM
ncbi:MAG: carboxypeptidase regulatory-like domain-containing protein, partial [Candidatus Eremiobacteraeota bacterium]|nr:carboxypeptidase regulatory-like domain-containing protein [Candidatus Eremiobacteraeota bacterium]